MTNVIILILVVLVAFLANIAFSYINSRGDFSFKKYFDLVNVPIVTFYSGKNKLNFLLDTGSTNSHISKKASKLLTGTLTNTSLSCVTSTGLNEDIDKAVYALLSYKGKDYTVSLFINKGLDAAFENTNATKGLDIHGILGSDFINEYSCIIDFNKYTIKYGKRNKTV